MRSSEPKNHSDCDSPENGSFHHTIEGAICAPYMSAFSPDRSPRGKASCAIIALRGLQSGRLPG